MKGGRPNRISEVAITIEKLATRLGNSIGPGAKIQKLLDAMHPQLRKAVKPGFEDRTDTEWPKIVKLAERHDNVLYDTGTYSKEDWAYHHPKSAALEQTNNWQSKKMNWNTNPKPTTLKNRSKPERKCYFCQKPGHFIKDCRKRKAQNANRQNIRTAVAEVGSNHANKTFEEFMQ